MRCRSIVRNGAAWARSAVVSPPATARSAACRWSRKPTSTAISNIICPMSATAFRFPARERGHEGSQHETRARRGVANRRRNVSTGRKLRSRLQGGLCRGRSRQQGSRRLAQSKEAEALAKASIYQAENEKEAWKALEIH